MRRQLGLLVSAAMLAMPLPARAADDPGPRIVVTGTGMVSTLPDRAIIAYTLRGEGPTSDAAVTALVARRRAVDAGLAGLSARAEARATQVSIQEVRGRECDRNGYAAPRLSTGDCAVVGYAASLSMEARTSGFADAGTMVGLIGRLGGTNPRIERFGLEDDTDARRRATIAALADARRQADAIAQGTGVTLGRVLSASTGSAFNAGSDEIEVTARRIAEPPPPPPAPPPVAVDLKPRPITTQVRVQMVYAIAP